MTICRLSVIFAAKLLCMVQLDLKVPTLVSHVMVNDKPHFHLRPLFFSYPHITDRRFQHASDLYKKEIRQSFKYYELTRSVSPQLLWFLFNPDTVMERRQMEFKMGRELIRGAFMLIHFEINALKIVYLPQLNNMMYIEQKVAAAVDLDTDKLEKAIRKQLKKEKDRLGDDFDINHYYTDNRDFISSIPLRLEVKFGQIEYVQEEAHHFFAALFEKPDFQGITEVQKVGNDLSDLYPNQLQRAFFRESIVEKLHQAIYHSKNTPVAIIGREGSGRHTVVHETVFRYLQKYRKDDYQMPTIWHIDPTRIIAGMSYVGLWQQRFEAIIQYLKKPFPKKPFTHKMLVDNPVALLRIGKSAQNDMTLSDVLKPYLEKRELQLILIATAEEWSVFQEKDRSFANLFQIFRITEPDNERAIKMILEHRKQLEQRHETRISIAAIKQLLYLQRNYFKNKALPGSVIKLMQQLAIKYKEDLVDVGEVRDSFQATSGLEEHVFDTAYTYDADEIERELRQQLVGQPAAIKVLANLIHIFKAKLNNKQKPVASLLFIGPTGVGKTQAAKVLAKYLMGSEENLLRFDMNEFIDASAPQRLIGDHYNPEGQLTGKVRYRPFSIILLDELEKAHPLVLDLLLQVLDDGRLTDSQGRTVDFTNTIIIMTSNLGAAQVDAMISINKNQTSEGQVYQKAVENAFRPEFVNRIDDIVVFKNLAFEHVKGIARLQINELLKRDGFVRRTTILNISNDALEWVAQRGYDEKMGGRAMRRQIERDLTALSADQLLKIRTNQPIILNVDLRNSQLQPSIHALDFIARNVGSLFPKIEEIKSGGAFYNWLLRNLENLIEEISENEEEQPQLNKGAWLYYDFKAKLDLLKEKLRFIIGAHEDPNYHSVQGLRLKQVNIKRRRNPNKDDISREDLKDILFQEAALKEINDGYRFANPAFDQKNASYVAHFLETALLSLFAKKLDQKEQVRLHFTSLVSNLGEEEVIFLMECYSKLFADMKLSYHSDLSKKEIILEGYNLYEFLRGETGVHLFYLAQRNPLPIYLDVSLDGNKEVENYTTIRLYDKDKTITDLRTSYSNSYDIQPDELKILVFGGIDQSNRHRLLAIK